MMDARVYPGQYEISEEDKELCAHEEEKLRSTMPEIMESNVLNEYTDVEKRRSGDLFLAEEERKEVDMFLAAFEFE